VQNHPTDRRRRLSVRALTSSVLSFAAVSLVALSHPAEAQTYDPRYPVCMKLYEGPFGGEWIDCSFTTLPQCRATASGRAAMCVVNPFFAQAPDLLPSPHRRHRRAG
jgi:Protein of unknown function (DUF3551)